MDERKRPEYLYEHARNAYAEILEALGEGTHHEGFDKRAHQLVAKHHHEEHPELRLLGALRHISRHECQQHRLDEYRRQNGRSRHREERRIDQRREDRREQSHLPSELICRYEREEIDRQEGQSSLRHEVA